MHVARCWLLRAPRYHRVDSDGADDRNALQRLLREDRYFKQSQDVLNLQQENRAERSSQGRAGAAKEADAANDCRGDYR